MANTVEVGVQAGLNMLAIASGSVAITWPRHEKGKLMKIKRQAEGLFTTFATFKVHNGGVTLRNCTEDEVLMRVKALMQTTRYRPIVFFVNRDNEKVPLFIPKNGVINTRPNIGTEFIGANMMRLDHLPAAIDILQKFVYVPSEVVEGKAPRAYDISGLKQLFQTGYMLNPFTRFPFSRVDIRPTNNWRSH
jgi:hypothetical protein